MTTAKVLELMKKPGIKWEFHPLNIPDWANPPLCKIRGVALVGQTPILFTPLTWAIYCEEEMVLTTKTDIYFLSHILKMPMPEAADILLATGCWDPKRKSLLKNKMLEIINDVARRNTNQLPKLER